MPYFRAAPVSAGPQWPLIQSNPNAKEVYFGLAYSGPSYFILYTKINSKWAIDVNVKP